MKNSDLIVIGAGPGGYELAAKAAERGLAVTLIERDLLGGTCLNCGCIPTKALCRSAEVLATIRNGSEYGISIDGLNVDYAAAVARKDRIVEQLREGIESLLSKVDIVRGEARFVSVSVVRVGDEEYTAPNIIVATGSKPAVLPVDGAGMAMSSDDILSMTQLPGSIAIIGGGVIGLEFASILNAYGVEISVVEYCKEILPGFDADIAKRLRQLLSRRGVRFVTGAQVTALSDDGVLHYQAKGKDQILAAEKILMAVGRKPVIPDGLDEFVEIGPRGVVTDCDFRTSTDGIYAIGDVNGRCMLAHAATAQGLHVLDVITDHKPEIRDSVIPAAVFTDPEVAMVGATEDSLAASGAGYAVAKAMYRSNGKALAIGANDGFVKLIYDLTDRSVLGCHIIGAHASDLIHEVAVAINAGLPVDILQSTIHAHPSLSELINQAAACSQT